MWGGRSRKKWGKEVNQTLNRKKKNVKKLEMIRRNGTQGSQAYTLRHAQYNRVVNPPVSPVAPGRGKKSIGTDYS